MLPRHPDQAPGARRDAPTSVYRYYDEHGVLIYVGVTSRGIARNLEHNTSKAWWPFVASQSVEHYAARPEALAQEARLVAEFHPPFNTQMNPGYPQAREAYLLFRESVAVDVQDAERQLRFVMHSQDPDGSNTILRSVAFGGSGQVITSPKLRAVTDRRKYGSVVKVWRHGPFIMARIAGKLPPVTSARSRIVPTRKPTGIKLDNLFMDVKYHVPSKSRQAR